MRPITYTRSAQAQREKRPAVPPHWPDAAESRSPVEVVADVVFWLLIVGGTLLVAGAWWLVLVVAFSL